MTAAGIAREATGVFWVELCRQLERLPISTLLGIVEIEVGHLQKAARRASKGKFPLYEGADGYLRSVQRRRFHRS